MTRNLRLKESIAVDYGFSPELPADEADAQKRVVEARMLRQKHGPSAQYLVNFAEGNLPVQTNTIIRELPTRVTRRRLVG